MNRGQYLTFFINAEEYAVSILRVREIIEYESVTHVPTTPAHVRGVIDLRGAVLPVIDLGAKFGSPQSAPARTTCIVVVETRLNDDDVIVGVIADAVSEVIDLAEEQIETAPGLGTNIRVDFLLGMARLDGRLALVLNPDRILSPVELQEALVAIPDSINSITQEPHNVQ